MGTIGIIVGAVILVDYYLHGLCQGTAGPGLYYFRVT